MAFTNPTSCYCTTQNHTPAIDMALFGSGWASQTHGGPEAVERLRTLLSAKTFPGSKRLLIDFFMLYLMFKKGLLTVPILTCIELPELVCEAH